MSFSHQLSHCISQAGPSRLYIARTSLRSFSTTFPSLRPSKSNFSKPGPPPLPPKEQAEFDALLKANQSVGASPEITKSSGEIEKDIQHRDIRRGPRPEFSGDTNPKTGETGGPKVDPFKAGDGDWQYGGRVTDF